MPRIGTGCGEMTRAPRSSVPSPPSVSSASSLLGIVEQLPGLARPRTARARSTTRGRARARYRQPVGKTVIHYCNSVTCWMLGAEKVRERLCRHLNVELGEMSSDGEYTILPIVCLGACDHAPVVMVGDELRLDITENAVNEIFGR